MMPQLLEDEEHLNGDKEMHCKFEKLIVLGISSS